MRDGPADLGRRADDWGELGCDGRPSVPRDGGRRVANTAGTGERDGIACLRMLVPGQLHVQWTN